MCLVACGRPSCNPNPNRSRRTPMTACSFRLSQLLLPLLLIPLTSHARDWQVDAAKSSLTFKGTYQNGPFEGRFAKFDAAISFDEADVAKDRFDVKVDMASTDTKSSERDDTLRTADFFDTAKYPQAHFVTTS